MGNIGLDLLRRTGKLDFDFSTMVLKVELLKVIRPRLNCVVRSSSEVSIPYK